ncbi:MAG: glycerate dehydrogenase [Bradymonadia bacterium]|jgi:glycerate dehydrogenase
MLRSIVVLDANPANPGDLPWNALEALGDLTVHASTAPDQTWERAGEADVIVTNKVRLDGTFFARGPKAKLVTILATGTDTVDLDAAKAAGVTVCNVPAYSTMSTAQMTLALVLELTQGAGAHSAGVHAGEWARRTTSYWHSPLIELADKQWTVVGFGAIGQAVGRIASALGSRVVAAQLPGRESPERDGVPRVQWADAWQSADVVSVHLPLTPDTRRIVGAREMAWLGSEGLLVNTGRGPLVDPVAARAALDAGTLGGFATDVLDVEPPPADHVLYGAPRCVITPHIAWCTREARTRLLDATATNIASYFAGQTTNVVAAP